jgi:hypothetical protein
MQYLPIQPNLESKTRPKQLLGSLPLDIALPALSQQSLFCGNYCCVLDNFSEDDLYYLKVFV